MEHYNQNRKETQSHNDHLAQAAYDIKKLSNHTYQNPGLDSLLKADEKIIADELDNIEFQIAEREKIKHRNLRFLEWQREKLEELVNRTKCFGYMMMGSNEVRNRLTTQLIQVELKKGEEYVNAFRDVQRLEEEKRKLMTEAREDEGWLKY